LNKAMFSNANMGPKGVWSRELLGVFFFQWITLIKIPVLPDCVVIYTKNKTKTTTKNKHTEQRKLSCQIFDFISKLFTCNSSLFLSS